MRVVLAEVIAAGSISLVLLAFAYPVVWTTLWDVQTAVTASRKRLALFTAGVLLLPLLAIAAGALLG